MTPPTTFTDYYTGAMMTNVTAIKPTASTFLTVWLDAPGVSRPGVSNSNPAAGSTVANAVLANAGVNNAFDVYNASGTTDLVIDVEGTFEYFAPDFPPQPAIAKRPAARRRPGRQCGRRLAGCSEHPGRRRTTAKALLSRSLTAPSVPDQAANAGMR